MCLYSPVQCVVLADLIVVFNFKELGLSLRLDTAQLWTGYTCRVVAILQSWWTCHVCQELILIRRKPPKTQRIPTFRRLRSDKINFDLRYLDLFMIYSMLELITRMFSSRNLWGLYIYFHEEIWNFYLSNTELLRSKTLLNAFWLLNMLMSLYRKVRKSLVANFTVRTDW